ncbi:MAG: hypothetical protein MK102_05790 [Fuerstiella sp.]|nr:hypothetical protein [Fuerstiella sp.]
MKHALLQNSQGNQPEVVVDDVFPEGIVDIAYAAEAATILIVTTAGSLILLRRDGTLLKTKQAFDGVRFAVWSDIGNFGAAAIGRDRTVCFDSNLQTLWNVRVTGKIQSIAITPFGSHLAISDDSARTYILTTDRQQVAKFDTTKALNFVQFVAERPRLIGAAEFGHLCCHSLTGEELWNQRLSSNVGSLSVTSCGRRILLAGFNHGIQMLTSRGKQRGSFMVDGIPATVSVSANRRRITALTLESRIYWMNFEGDILWAADLSMDPPTQIAAGPLGERLFVVTQSGRLLQLRW